MRRRATFAAAAVMAGSAAFGAAPVAVAPAAGEAAHVAGVLVNDARDTLRDVTIAPVEAAKQAVVLLQFAATLDPADVHTQRLLAQTAAAAGQTDVQKEALRKVIAGDPGDLVSQVRYIDLLAGASQRLEDQAKIYQGALDQSALDPQIRSAMALRLARFASGRQDWAGAKQFLTRALQLNDVNVGALREMVRVTGSEGNLPANRAEHLKAVAALLVANPLEPDAWVDAASLCSLAGLHERAADFYKTAAEQEQINGTGPDLALLRALVVEEGLAGQFKEALAEGGALAKLPGAPLESLLVMQLIQDETAAASRPMGAQTQEAASQNGAVIIQRLKATVEAAKGDARATALADAAGIAWTVLGGPPDAPEAVAWTDDYAKLVTADDPTLARLRGWQLYREGKLDDAAKLLEKVAATDPLAQVGLARVYLEEKNSRHAEDLLQDLWGTYPGGLLALQVKGTARRAGITLREGNWAQQMRAAAAGLTPAVMTMHRNIADTVLMTANYKVDRVGFGEPVLVTVRQTNTTERAIPVGDDGVLKTSLGLGAVGPGPEVTLGLYAVEDMQRVYRIGAHQFVDGTLRADQGALGDILRRSPEKGQRVTLWAVSSPRMVGGGDGREFATGVGGEGVAVGDFTANGFALSTAAEVEKFLADLNAASGEQKLIRIDAAGAMLREMADPKSPLATLPAKAKDEAMAAFGSLAKSADVLVRAEFLHALPADKAQNAANQDMKTLANDSDPLVKLMYARYAAKVEREAKATAAQGGAATRASGR